MILNDIMPPVTLYNIGDRVVVREDLSIDGRYSNIGREGELNATGEMIEYAGKTVTISLLQQWSSGNIYYVAKELNGFVWSDEMFDGLEDDKIEQSLVSIERFLG